MAINNENYSDIIPKFKNGIIGYNVVTDLEAVKNSLMNLFLIQQGEVPGKPWLGNTMNVFLFDQIGFFEEKSIETAFINVIQNFEPRVQIVNLKVNINEEYNNISLNLQYYVLYGEKSIIQNYRFDLNYNTLSYTNTLKL